jgi:hypothetical protein
LNTEGNESGNKGSYAKLMEISKKGSFVLWKILYDRHIYFNIIIKYSISFN